MKKRLLSLLLALALCLVLIPPARAAQSGIQASGGTTFSLTTAVKASGDLVRWFSQECVDAGGNVDCIKNYSLEAMGSGYKAVAECGMDADYWLKENGDLLYYTVMGKATSSEVSGVVLTNVEQINDGTALKKDGSVWISGNPLEFSRLTDNAVQICGQYALKKDGSLWTWDRGGENLHKMMDDVAYVTHGMAIKNDGTLWTWGRNDRGQLGTGGSSKTPASTPVKVMDHVVGAWSSSDDTPEGVSRFALTADGSLYSWGNNTCGLNGSGQLGYTDGNETIVSPANPEWGFPEMRYNYQTTPRKVDIDNAAAVCCVSVGGSGYTTMVLKKDGTLWAAGAMNYVMGVWDNTKVSSAFQKLPIDGIKVPEPLRFGGAAAPESPAVPDQPAAPESPAKGRLVTGSLDMPQLSKQEIIDLLAANPAAFSGQLFDSQPSCSAPYAAGKLSDAALQAALNRLNALRRIAGMPAAQLDKDWCESAQYGAVILGQMGSLSHTPPRPSDMSKDFYDKAYAAAYSSNLSAGSALVASVDSLMRDYTAKNITSVGHRRWQLSPALSKVGFGHVDNGGGYGKFTDVKVFDRDEGFSVAHQVNYDSFGWPSAGYFPNDLDSFTPDCPWTVSLNPDIYAAPSGITVKISGGGRSWTLSGSYAPADSGAYLGITPADNWNYGGNHCIAFRPDGADHYEGVYTVEIQGLKSKKDRSSIPFTYQVEFFSTAQTAPSGTEEKPSAPSKPADQTAPTTPAAPANPTAPTTPIPSGGNPFTDVPSGAYYTDAVLWAYQNSVTAGITATTFAPSAACTRGQVMTFLWRAKGEPEPKTTVNPFQDVKPSDYYYKAVLWAYENGITSGTTATAFSPGNTCTNGHVVTFLWRANGEPLPEGTSSLAGQFKNSYYTSAVAWADTTGLLEDTGAAFDPASMSPRANIVTYLYRNLTK